MSVMAQSKVKSAQPLEVQLLLSCTRTQIDLTTADQIEMLCHADLDWQWVLELAAENDISGLLYQSLGDVCPVAVPPFVLNQLAERVQTCTFDNVFFTQELLKLLQLLAAHQIPAFPYKGAVLATSLYGSLALRPFCDLDILIQPKHFIAVKALLVEAGYDTLKVDDGQETANIWSDAERDFIQPDRRVTLDLHWRITPRCFPFELPVSDLWQRRQSLSLLELSIPTLAPEDLLLSLCVHGAKECWGKLKWVCDVAELMRVYPALDWDIVWQRAEQFHSQRMLQLGLLLASELLDAKLPERLHVRINSDRTLCQLVPQVYGYLFGTLPAYTHRLSPTLFRLWVRDRWQDRCQYFIWRIFVPNVRDRQIISLPQSLSFLYYLIRPLRLIGEKLNLWSRPVLGNILEQTPGIKPNNRMTQEILNITDYPCRKALDSYDLGEELFLYSEEQELGITLNQSSKQIWQLCDGTHSLNEIATAISQSLGCSREILLEDIYATILKFQESGLLES